MKKSASLHNNNGAALIYLISTLLIVSILGTAIYTLTSTSVIGEVSANHLDRAYYMAEAGFAYAYPLIMNDIQDNDNFDYTDKKINNQTFTLDEGNEENGQFSIKVEVDDSDILLTVTGIINGGVSAGTEARILYTIDRPDGGGGGDPTPFKNAVFAGSSVRLGRKAFIIGNVATNADSISSGTGSSIWGTTTTNAGITMPSVPFSCDSCTSDGSINNSRIWSDGTMNYKDLTLGSEHVSIWIWVTGDVTLNVSGDFAMNKNSRIMIAPNASLKMVVNGNATFSSESRVDILGRDKDKGKFVLNGTRNTGTVTLGKNAEIEGAIYAPDSQVDIHSGARITGGLIGDTVNMGQRSLVIWDEDVSDVTPEGGGGTGTTGGGDYTQSFLGG